MSFTNQNQPCHAERSEAPLWPSQETLSEAKGDNTLPMLGMETHNRMAFLKIEKVVE